MKCNTIDFRLRRKRKDPNEKTNVGITRSRFLRLSRALLVDKLDAIIKKYSK